MSRHPSPRIASRKEPQQARSAELVAAILEAASQVLAQQGAGRFTTARVAERAGVSVGSVYQYFPNKASILFRLQAEEWLRTTRMLREIFEEDALPEQRLRRLVHAFLRSECEEAGVRAALGDAAPLYRDSPEAREARAEGDRLLQDFLAEALQAAPASSRELAADLIGSTLAAVGSGFSRERRQPAEIAAYAEAMADMFCAYLETLRRAGSGGE